MIFNCNSRIRYINSKVISNIITRVIVIGIFLFPISKICAQDIVTNINTQDTVFQTKFSSNELKNAPTKLIPYPQKVLWDNEVREIKQLQILFPRKVSKLLTDELFRICTKNNIEINPESAYYIQFTSDKKLPKEAYKIEVTNSSIQISASSEEGHYYALQTFRQLIGKKENICRVQLCSIEDEPAYSIRGYMIDVGRNFQSIASLKRQLDIMAMYKMNIFHWHLTDRPAWRIKSKIYPELTAPENHRPGRDPGKCYTYGEIRELIFYARKKKITVISEIDMPGHSDSFTTAMGCKMESPEGMIILENILNEFFNEIPEELAPMIHIGSDEVHISNREEFISKMVSIVESNNRKVIIWSPGLKAKNTVIRQTWGSQEPIQGDFQEIDSRKNYINNGEPMSHINSLFFKPIGSGSKNEILGGIICLWPDVNLKNEEDAFTQNPVYPSLLTYAWATWTADVISAPNKYLVQLPPQGTEASVYFDAFETFLMEHKHRFFEHHPFQYFAQSNKHWKIIGPFDKNDGDSILINNEKQSYHYKGQQLAWIPSVGNTLVIKHRWMKDGYFPQAKSGQTVYALTYIHSEEERDIEAWINFETPLRANRIYTGIPYNGEWDINGGVIFINDKKLPGPEWNNPGWKTGKQKGWGTAAEQENPWTEEELYWTRKSSKVHLKKGWNKIFVKIPSTSDFQNWMFTFVPLDMNGLRFSANPE